MVEGTGGKERILGFRRSSICSEESSSYCFRFLTTVDYQFSVGASRRFSKGIVGIRISFFFKKVLLVRFQLFRNKDLFRSAGAKAFPRRMVKGKSSRLFCMMDQDSRQLW